MRNMTIKDNELNAHCCDLIFCSFLSKFGLCLKDPKKMLIFGLKNIIFKNVILRKTNSSFDLKVGSLSIDDWRNNTDNCYIGSVSSAGC